MAQKLQNITIQAPGFAGINTQDSPVGLDPSFASVANNCVIDQYGRVGARKGYSAVSSNGSSVLGSSRGIETIHEYLKNDGTKVVFSAGNNKIFTGTTTLAEVTLPVGYTISANNWKVVTFNNDVYFFQRGHNALVSVAGSTTLIKVIDGSHLAPAGNEVLAAYGRLWVADVTNNKHTVYWSDLLDGDDFHSGSAGSLNLRNVFPTGNDEIVALAAHNGFLIIFCKRSVIVYEGAETPSSDTAVFKIHDTIEGVGCVARDSVQHTGTDILFLSDSGVRSFGRTIQEKSMPMRDISKNVRNDLLNYVSTEIHPIKSVYSAEEAFYLLTFPTNNLTYCFDMRTALPNGSNRVTTWEHITPLSLTRLDDNKIYIGKSDGIYQYAGYTDNNSSYTLSYFNNPTDFGNSNNLKFLKKFNITIIGNASSPTTLNWGYDYNTSYNTKTIAGVSSDATVAEYGVAEYGIAEYNAQYIGGSDIQKPSVNVSGSGLIVTVGIESVISGSPYSIQKIDIQALLGRLI